MTHHNPISLSVEDLNNVDLSVEDLNNIDLSAEDAHKITLSVIDWFYVQILNAIVAQAAVKLGATALCSVLSKINAESAAVLGASGSLKAPARIVGSAGMDLGATAEAEVSVTARIIALASVVLGSEAVMTAVSKIIGAAGVGLGATANVVSPSKVNASAGVSVGASGVAAVRSLLVAQSGAQFGAKVAAKCPAIIIGSAGMDMGATAELDAWAVLWTPAVLGSSVLQLWLDANDESTITKDGSNYVSQWDDKSGNGNHATQSTGSLQPIYNSAEKQITFDRTNDIMYLPLNNGLSTIANGNNTVFAVGNQNGAVTGGFDVCRYIAGFKEATVRWGMWWIPNENMYQCKSGGSTSWGWDGRLTIKHLRGMIRNGTFLSRRQYDTQKGSVNDCVDVPDLDDVSIGFKLGSLSEIVVLNQAISNADRQRLEGYFAHKWGFPTSLQSTHPFYSAPPVYVDPATYTPISLGTALKLWLDSSDISTIIKGDGDNIAQWSDKSGNNNHVYQSTPSLQPTHSTNNSVANNKPAVVFPNTTHGIKLKAASALDLKEVIFVCAYKDGTDSDFDDYDGLISGTGAYGAPRVMGNINTAQFITTSQFNNSATYKNGSESSSTTVLPASLCMIDAVCSSIQNQIWTIGGINGNDSDRGWKGVICEVIGVNRNLTAVERDDLWRAMQYKWGITV